ncbi:hypothetical protein [Streptomyces sp. NPDC059909]|uniref:hypothetical protein n=1 Tax=Streptomyces sp. NPDC059909 TaxID=3346998 RepID=UPI00365CC6DA
MVFVYGALLAAAPGDESFLDAGWTSSAAERLHPYGAAVAESWATFVQDTAHVTAWIRAVAHWPLMALTLLWLAHRRQGVYVRGAIALLLSSSAGLAVFASLQSFPVREVSLVRDYLALPGVHASWYLLMALAVVATAAKVRARVAVMVLALSAVAGAVLTAEHHLLGALLAVGAPLLAWYAAGHLQDRDRVRRRSAVDASHAAEPEADVVPFRHRGGAVEPRADADLVPLRQAG